MLTAGLFGKLPAHGDFVWRGWPDPLVAQLDGWLTAGVAALRGSLGEAEFADVMTTGPLWHCWLALDAELALVGVITPTVDSAGRLFMLVAGVVGPSTFAWAVASQQPGFAAEVEGAVYDALAGQLDADALQARLAASIPPVDGVAQFLASLSRPGASAFWVPNPAAGPPVALPAATLGPETLASLLQGATFNAA